MITENYEKYMDKRWEENHKTMTAKECERILQTMAVGACRTEKEAIDFAIKKIKQAKKAKRWKQKYLELREYLGVDEMRTVYFGDRSVEEVTDALNVIKELEKRARYDR